MARDDVVRKGSGSRASVLWTVQILRGQGSSGEDDGVR